MTTDKYDIVLTIGCFDMLHHGHVQLLREMRNIGARVDVIVHDDISMFKNKGKFPVQYIRQRERNLKSIGIVDYVLETKDKDPSSTLNTYLDIKKHKGKKIAFMRGNDWEDFPGKDILEKYNIPIIYKEYTKGISSTKLRDEIS